MALRDMVTEWHDVEGDEPEVAMPARRAAAPTAPLFSGIEEQVIALAAHDGLATLETPGLLERVARVVFGLGKAGRTLADERLEALRRAVVVARHRHHLPDPVAMELRRHGFGMAQLRAIEARAIA